MSWGAANARARGLATHLLTREVLSRAAGAGSWEMAARVLAERGYPLAERDLVSRTELDRAIGRITADRLGILARWLGARGASLAVTYALEERRSLRRLLRGTAQGISPDHRLSGLTPTPGLPARVLRRLSLAPSLEGLRTALLRAGHPAGRALPSGGKHSLSLWEAELALDRMSAARVIQAARPGGRMLRHFAALCIDLENAWSLLGAKEWGSTVLPGEVFLPGGRMLDLEAFSALAANQSREAVRRGLARRFDSSPLEPVFQEPVAAGELESRAVRALVAWQRGEARRDPLSVSTVLGVTLRIRAEAHDVRLVVFATDLGAPGAMIASGLETAA